MRFTSRLAGSPYHGSDTADWLQRARLPVIATLANGSWGLVWLVVVAIMALGGY